MNIYFIHHPIDGTNHTKRRLIMKKLIVVVATALVSLSFAGMSVAADQAPAKKPSVKKEQTITETATVEAVDQATRVVTLKGSKGNVFDITAGEEVRNLAQVKVSSTAEQTLPLPNKIISANTAVIYLVMIVPLLIILVVNMIYFTV